MGKTTAGAPGNSSANGWNGWYRPEHDVKRLRGTFIEEYQTTNQSRSLETVRAITNPTPNKRRNRDVDQLSHVDRVTTNTHSSQGESQLYIFEDSEAVIKMIIKGRSPMMRRVSRTHAVALDWFFDRINLDPQNPNQIILTPRTNSQTPAVAKLRSVCLISRNLNREQSSSSVPDASCVPECPQLDSGSVQRGCGKLQRNRNPTPATCSQVWQRRKPVSKELREKCSKQLESKLKRLGWNTKSTSHRL